MTNLFVSSETKFELRHSSTQPPPHLHAVFSMVNTRQKNKDTHPGVPDQRNPRKAKDTNTTQDEHQRAIQKVAEVEHTLMEAQQRANESAHQPPGPKRSEKRQV